MMWPTSPSSVAENSIVWVRPVQWRRIHSTCGVKPSSAIRSASSRTTMSTSASATSPALSRSIKRSGVATTISTPSPRAVDLLRPARPAVHGEDALAAVVGDRFEHLGDLHGQLTGRYEHEAERAVGSRLLDDPRQHRHAERQRLAGAGARPAAHVAAGEGDGDRRALDLERLGVTGRGEAGVDALGHAELGESGRRLDGWEGGDPRQRSGSLDGRPARLACGAGRRRARGVGKSKGNLSTCRLVSATCHRSVSTLNTSRATV